MIVTGLENNNYLVKNVVNINVQPTLGSDTIRLNIKVTNTVSLQTLSIELFPINQTYIFSISEIVKTLYIDYDMFNNAEATQQEFEIEFTSTDSLLVEDITTITKMFIYGYNINDGNTNWYLDDQILQAEPFDNFSFAYNIMNLDANQDSQYQIVGGIVSELFSPITVLQVEKCDGKMLWWKNKYGVPSNWYFSHWEIEDKSKTEGFVNVKADVLQTDEHSDIGNTFEREITFIQRIKKEHYDILLDLIRSEEVYITTDDFSTRLRLKSNKFTINSKENTYYFECKFYMQTLQIKNGRYV